MFLELRDQHLVVHWVYCEHIKFMQRNPLNKKQLDFEGDFNAFVQEDTVNNCFSVK